MGLDFKYMAETMSTFYATPSDIEKKWHHIDATDLVVGRVAVHVARILMGKHKPTYTPHMDDGDYVVITNCEKVLLTGKKGDLNTGKLYHRHTGHPGGVKTITAGKRLTGKPRQQEQVLREAIRRMLPKNKMGRNILSHLYVYPGDSHPHTAQQPKSVDLAAINVKNKKRLKG